MRRLIRYPTRSELVLGATAFLAVGLLLRPAGPPPTPAEETQAPLLQQVVQQREAQTTFRLLQEVAAATIPSAAYVSAPEPPATEWSDWDPALQPRGPTDRYAVAVGPRSLLAYGKDLPDEVPVHVRFSDGRTVAAHVTARFPRHELVLLAVEDGTGELAVPSRIAPGPTAGDAVVATAPGPNGEIVAPLFISSAGPEGATTTTALEAFLGMPVFGTDRALVGIVAQVQGEARVVSIADAMTAPTEESPPAPVLGLSLSERQAAAPGARDVVVTSVAPGSRASRAGLRPGDLLLDVNDESVADLQQAVARLAGVPAAEIRLRVRRGRRTLTVTVATESETTP